MKTKDFDSLLTLLGMATAPEGIKLRMLARDKPELLIEGRVDDDMLNWVCRAIEILRVRNSPDLIVRISCVGGGTIASFHIHDLLRNYEGFVTGVVTDVCYSAATTILQACDERISYANARFLIHHTSKDFSYGELGELTEKETLARKEKLDSMERHTDTILDILALRSKKGRKLLLKVMSKDERIDATRALELGIIDRIITAPLKKRSEGK